MARPTLTRSPAFQGSIAANNELRFGVGLNYPIRALHLFLLTAAAVALTEAQSEADVANIKVEMDGVNIYEITPARLNDVERFYRQAVGGNVTDDGRYTIRPHLDLLRDELLVETETGKPVGVIGPTSPEWGTGGLNSLVLVVVCAGTVTNLGQARLYVEYDSDPARAGEKPGVIYRLRTMPQSGLGTGWNNITSLWKKGTKYQKILALHFILDSAVIDATEGVSLKINEVPRFYAPPGIFDRKNLAASYTNISGYKHVVLLDDKKLSSGLDVGADAGVAAFTPEVNYSTAPTGNDNTVLAEDLVDWDELRAA